MGRVKRERKKGSGWVFLRRNGKGETGVRDRCRADVPPKTGAGESWAFMGLLRSTQDYSGLLRVGCVGNG